MFDVYRINRGSNYTTVTEKRAPTDESVRLLREMEEAARAEVLAVYKTENNLFHATAVRMPHTSCGDDILYVRLAINGERYEFERRIDGALRLIDKSTYINAIRDAVAHELSAIITRMLLHPSGTKQTFGDAAAFEAQEGGK